LMGIDSNNPVRMTFGLDRYLRYRFTIGLLYEELALALDSTAFKPDSILKDADYHLPIRKQLLPRNRTLLDFNSQVRVPGVHVTFAFARTPETNGFGDDFGIMLQRRSAHVSMGQGSIAVVPSGTHQPSNSNKDRDSNHDA